MQSNLLKAVKRLLLSVFLLGTGHFSIKAQSVGIGTKFPHLSAALEIKSDTLGLLIPRGNLALLGPSNPANSLLFFNTNVNLPGEPGGAGFYYNRRDEKVIEWVKLLNNLDGWTTKGNSGLAALNYLGTTDNVDLRLVRGGVEGLRITAGGALLSRGGAGTGSVPTSGAGARMMWVPLKYAFRAGVADGVQWDDANIGDGSLATGTNTVASGKNATAMGLNSTATGTNAISTGTQTIALGKNATATGLGSIAIGENSTAMGEGTIANAFGSLVIGRFNVNTPAPPVPANTDKVFQIGGGISDGVRIDAFFVTRVGSATLAGTLTENSDIRLKEKIKPLNGVLNSINNIQPISYYFKDKQSHPANKQIGFSAQEIEKQFPELVSKDDKGYLSVSYGHLTAVAIQAIKEQQEIINQLNKNNENLKNEVIQLQNQMQEVLKKVGIQK